MDKVTETIKKIGPIDSQTFSETQKRLDNLTKPLGSLGRLEELAKIVVAITSKKNPKIKNKIIFTLASDHGVTEEKVSAYPKEVTPQMVYNFLHGGAGINVLANYIGAKVIVVDIGVASDLDFKNINIKDQEYKAYIINTLFKNKKISYGTKNFTKGPAMTKEEALKSIQTGIELVEEHLASGIDIIGTGDMGIGNTTASSSIGSVITNTPVENMTGRGTGITDEILKNKINIIKKALKINKPDPKDGTDILSKVGGYEIGGIAGIILACAAYKIPVVIDGFISTAGALIAYKLEPKVKDYIIASHTSAEQGHKIMLKYLGISPLFDLNLRLGEGTGAALGISLVEASIKILNEMATFESAGVSEKNV